MSPEVKTAGADLVVVGGGPRALYALADLDAELARGAPAAPLRVIVLEPGVPGAGAVWAPSQPAHLLMNVDVRIVDATCPAVPHTFRQWHRGDGEPFPPRAEVGRYLEWSFERLCESPRLEVVHRPARVAAVHREGDDWVCETVDGAGEPATPECSRRVLLVTGHAGGAGIDHAALSDASRRPYAGDPIVIRGASLTAFDVVLDLTVGRGGRWAADAGASSGLRYLPSGAEPSSITLVSRSGEPMLPKPTAIPLAVATAIQNETARWDAGSTPDDAWWEVLVEGAVAAASAAGTVVTRQALWARLDAIATEPAEGRWARDVRRARGEVDGDPAWWWGRAWSAGYADVVRSLERAPRDRAWWPRWRTRAAALERWAFGPPLVTHRRLLALRDAGLLHVTREVELADVRAGTITIDAFTQGPGISALTQPWAGADARPEPGREPWDGLQTAGYVMVRPGERGVLTAPDAACIGAHGRASAGLAALGRPTEDPVIGHDSLQRRLHGDSQRWAQALAAAWLLEHRVESTQLTKVGTHD